MSGYIGGILILSGCFMYGLSYSQRLKNRIIILKDMVRMLSVMNNHIGYSLIDMTQIFERLGDFDMCSYVRDFTGYICEALNKSVVLRKNVHPFLAFLTHVLIQIQIFWNLHSRHRQ